MDQSKRFKNNFYKQHQRYYKKNTQKHETVMHKSGRKQKYKQELMKTLPCRSSSSSLQKISKGSQFNINIDNSSPMNFSAPILDLVGAPLVDLVGLTTSCSLNLSYQPVAFFNFRYNPHTWFSVEPTTTTYNFTRYGDFLSDRYMHVTIDPKANYKNQIWRWYQERKEIQKILRCLRAMNMLIIQQPTFIIKDLSYMILHYAQ